MLWIERLDESRVMSSIGMKHALELCELQGRRFVTTTLGLKATTVIYTILYLRIGKTIILELNNSV